MLHRARATAISYLIQFVNQLVLRTSCMFSINKFSGRYISRIPLLDQQKFDAAQPPQCRIVDMTTTGSPLFFERPILFSH